MTDPRTVLIVDDDEGIRHALRLVFELGGYQVIGEARDGVEAVALGLRHQPTFVLLDYLMPRQSGEKTAEVLRTVSPGSRIVAFSAVLSEKPEWADAYLNKDRIGEVVPLLGELIGLEASGT